MQTKNMPTKKLTSISMYIAISLALNIFERSIPLTFIAPGVKLGLANIITLIVMFQYGLKEASIVMLSKVLISSLFYSGMSSFAYSLSGGVLSLLGMYLTYRYFGHAFSIVGISVIGSFLHITAQIFVMMLMIGSVRVAMYWYPILIYVSIITGMGVAFIANSVLSRAIDLFKE